MAKASTCTAELVLASRYEGIELVEHLLAQLVESRLWRGERDLQAVTTAAREAVANAIRHGNGPESGQPVRVEVMVDENRVRLTVVDHGAGFDPTAVPDPTAPENLLRPSGRGIFYMKQLMEQVEFAAAPDGGTVVSMSFRTSRPLVEGESPVPAESGKES